MTRLNKTEIKKAFFNVLTPYFKDIGFDKYLTSGDPTYVLNKKNIVISFFFNFYSNSSIGRSPFRLTHYEVEDYILDIGIPQFDINEYKKKKKYHLSTVEFRVNPVSLKKVPLNTIDEIEAFAQSFIKFYSNEGVSFIKKYTNLPEVVKELNTIGIDNWKDLIPGMGEVYIRGLLMSKLCNDPLYDEKFNKVNGMIQGAVDWLPYWEKYKDVLQTIEPKYSL